MADFRPSGMVLQSGAKDLEGSPLSGGETRCERSATSDSVKQPCRGWLHTVDGVSSDHFGIVFAAFGK